MTDSSPPDDFLDDPHRVIDAPFMAPDAWWTQIMPGTCSACGGYAEHGLSRWWHTETRVCPKLDPLRWHAEPPTFVAA